MEPKRFRNTGLSVWGLEPLDHLISLINSPSYYGYYDDQFNWLYTFNIFWNCHLKMHLIKTNTIYVGGIWKQWTRQQTTSLSLASNF